MRVLTIYAHHNPRSFCHAVLERFSLGLRDAGHSQEVVDLHAIGFDPVFREHDGPNWIDDSVPDDVLKNMNVRESLLDAAGNTVKRFMVKWWMGDSTPRQVIRRLRQRGGPADVAAQQQKVAQADALVFISPIYFVGFPAILKGWIERVFSLGFAFGFKPEAWRGDIRGRMPLLRHKKALIINTTIFDQRSYEDGLAAPITKLVDDYCLRYSSLPCTVRTSPLARPISRAPTISAGILPRSEIGSSDAAGGIRNSYHSDHPPKSRNRAILRG